MSADYVPVFQEGWVGGSTSLCPLDSHPTSLILILLLGQLPGDLSLLSFFLSLSCTESSSTEGDASREIDFPEGSSAPQPTRWGLACRVRVVLTEFFVDMQVIE